MNMMKKQKVAGDCGWARWDALVAVGVAAYEEEQRKAELEKLRNKNRVTMAAPEAFYYKGQYQEFKTNVPVPIIPPKRKPNFKLKRSEQVEPPSQPLPEALRDKIVAVGGLESSIVLVVKKILTKTDVDPHQNRLLMPFNLVKTHSFLTQRQSHLLERCEKIPALFIDPKCDDDLEMNLARWDMHKETKKSSNYALVKNWSNVVRKTELQSGDFIQLWGFKRGLEELGFALAKHKV